MTRWAILTGEYPPQPGGVADYTAQVAAGLAAAGDAVTVYAPPGAAAPASGVEVVRLPDHFGPRGLVALDRALARTRPHRVLVQYVPQAFGLKGMNLAFAAWVAARAGAGAEVWVMFHEVRVGFRPAWPGAVLGPATWAMARMVASAAARVFVSIPAWGELVRRLAPRAPRAEWLPVPSNLPTAAAPAREGVGTVVGHFGTFGPAVADLLEPTLVQLLAAGGDRSVALLGRGGDGFRDRLLGRHPALSGRVTASGELAPAAAAARLCGCDVLVQPFIDGVSTRRGSAMAGLANGVPVVTNLGPLSESVWPGLGCVALAAAPDPTAIARAAEGVLALTPADRAALGARGAAVYQERFGLANTLAKLRGAP